MKEAILGCALALGAAGCGEGKPAAPPAFAGSCRVLDATPIDEGAAPLGFSAADAAEVAPVRGGYRLLYGYDPRIDPSVALEAGIESFDPGAAFLVEQSVARIGDVEVPCPPALTFPAIVRFRTADGAFDETLPVDLFVTGLAEHEWAASVPLPSLRGAFEPVPERGWNHRAVNFAARFAFGRAVGGVSLTSEGAGTTRVASVGLFGENPPHGHP